MKMLTLDTYFVCETKDIVIKDETPICSWLRAILIHLSGKLATNIIYFQKDLTFGTKISLLSMGEPLKCTFNICLLALFS